LFHIILLTLLLSSTACAVPVASLFPPNPANMCVACLRTQVDISEGIPKQVTVQFCKQCERCVRLIDAGFLWTEPHSKRIKLKLTIQKEVMNGAILQQVFVIEFVIQYQMCDDCHRVEAKDFWKAVVQVRQKTAHKKTFYYLEQLILKHKLHQNALNIKEINEGIDFYYSTKQHAQKMVDFLQCTVPCRSKTSQRLISHDIHSNTFNYKSTYSMEIVPVCKDNVVCLSPRLAQSLGNMGQLCVCTRVTSTIHLIDPKTLQIAEVDGNTYWRNPFNSLCNPRQLEEFIVMDIDIIRDQKLGAGAGLRSNKHTLAELWVQKTSEMDTSQQYHCRTFLGHLLNIGDLVMGFDFANSNINDEHLNKMNPHHLPDVVLIKKSYDRSRRAKRRNWKLQEMSKDREGMDTDDERQYQDFLEDLEEDPALRKNVNIYRVESDTDDDGAPRISLTEMLEELSLSDATGGEGADMMTE
uniref:60S ribosomal export protein NMD3 n=1 Tax=Scophthalmus maximus TaxID=52904 RepID=A0A8D3ANQ8_SCOMX